MAFVGERGMRERERERRAEVQGSRLKRKEGVSGAAARVAATSVHRANVLMLEAGAVATEPTGANLGALPRSQVIGSEQALSAAASGWAREPVMAAQTPPAARPRASGR